METIKIKPDMMDILCRRAKEEGKSITYIIDEMLRSLLTNGKAVRLTCSNCRNEVDYEISDNKAYCDYCECVVFVENT